MNIDIAPGKYVVAVSGGVDSVVLLDLLSGQKNLELIVAHFDHGIRPDSKADRGLVQKLAKKYNLDFVYDEGHLGGKTSEAAARDKRYEFLHKTCEERGADAIITAHHQDDLIETAVINLIRGTGRRGLSSLRSTEAIMRPLLDYSKEDIKNYATTKKLVWHEDSTNLDDKYLRNYIRHSILPKFSDSKKRELLDIIDNIRKHNFQLDHELINQLHLQSVKGRLDRYYFIMLPHEVSLEVMATWLRLHGINEYDRPTLNRLVLASKIGRKGAKFDILKNTYLLIDGKSLALKSRER